MNCRVERSREDFDCYLAIVRSQYGGVMSSGDEIGPNEARDLGMGARIDRRDFLQGAAITAAAFGLAPELAQAAALERAAQDQPGYYPPALTGMRGSHPGSFEDAHALRDGTAFDNVTEIGRAHDLIDRKRFVRERVCQYV